MNEKEVFKKSEVMKQKRKEFIENYLNPHEAENRIFINEIIDFYKIKTAEQFQQYEHLIPDCATKLMFRIEFNKR